MLLAVEGGGFFSSSVSGYSKGLTLLVLGHKKEEKPMRVTPWNQYQLVDQEMEADELQLGSGKNRLVRGCTSFVCFGRAAGLETSSPLKVGPAQNQEVLPDPPVDKSKDHVYLDDDVVEDITKEIIILKSCLKKPVRNTPVFATGGDDDENKQNDVACQKERRKVQWMDTVGDDLFDIREFEMSESDSDDEFANGIGKTCSCRIM